MKIERLVRAARFYPHASPWGTPVAPVGAREIAILQAAVVGGKGHPGEVLRLSGEAIEVATGDGALRLEILLNQGVAVTPADLF